jgi:hypothetical protein
MMDLCRCFARRLKRPGGEGSSHASRSP